MRLANLTTSRILILFLFFTTLQINALAQDNSPYSRYGIGDLVPHTNVLNKGFGGASIGFTSDRFLNSSNPASYSFIDEPLTRKLDLGKAIIFELGTEFNGRTIKQQNPIGKYTTNNLVFSSMQLGMQLTKKGNWGATFGLMPIARENYKIQNLKRISNVDSAQTIYDGTGGAYKAFFGTAYKVKNFSFGLNSGYIFGKKNTTTNVRLLNDTIQYFESRSITNTNFGSAFLHLGTLYNHVIKDNENESRSLTIGATYELQNKLKANQDVERFVEEADLSNPGSYTDSIFIQKGVKGNIVLPATFGAGFTYQTLNKRKGNSFLVALDYISTAWDKYRFFNQVDQVQNSWTFRGGIQWKPQTSKTYWSRVNYRTGFHYGKDYIKAGGDLPVYALTFGFGLPITTNARFPYKDPAINIALETGKRGNNSNNLTENFIKLSLSVSMSDIWFAKRKYD
jgi:hypothetical protein